MDSGFRVFNFGLPVPADHSPTGDITLKMNKKRILAFFCVETLLKDEVELRFTQDTREGHET